MSQVDAIVVFAMLTGVALMTIDWIKHRKVKQK